MAENILVVGGAGYIGSHMVKMLAQNGHKVTVIDNLSTGHRDSVIRADLIELDMGDTQAIHSFLNENTVDAVMHFASYIEVGESIQNPRKYFYNNFTNTLKLLDALVENDIQRFIFSSSAAIYGKPQYTPIDEQHPKEPMNPYGRGKWMVEQVLEDYYNAYGLKSCSLRYFNASGADPEGELGERHNPETHLIPLILQVASGRKDAINIFGNDYDTQDGTCIRDYVHVNDICAAHMLAIDQLDGCKAYNLGTSNGFSVREVIAAVERVTGKSIKTIQSDRRPGDPAVLVADSSLATQELGWVPKYPELDVIVEHAWAWEQLLAAM